MERYAYLLISAFLFFPWMLIFTTRADLRKKIISAGIVGGIAGIPADFFWYFRDYWQPPTLRGEALVSIEEVLFGFLIAGIAVSLFDLVFKKKNIRKTKKGTKLFGLLFLSGVFLLVFLNNLLGINSIIATSFLFLFFTGVIITIRKDLLTPAISSGLLLALLIIPIYAVIFNLIVPDFWNKYWLFADNKLGITVLGGIPLTEYLWYFSWGALAGVAYDFARGKKKVPLKT